MIRSTLACAGVLLSLALPAQADGIEIDGTAQMGLVGGGPPGQRATRLYTDLDLQLRVSRTTDGGLTFGFEVDLDDLDLSDPVRRPYDQPVQR